MGFRKKRSKYFWVFSSYSFVLHLVGILALIILMGPPKAEPDSPPIPVRLVEAMPVSPAILPSPKGTKVPQPNSRPSSTAKTTSLAQPNPKLFRVIPPVHSSPRIEPEKATPSTHPLVQVAINALGSNRVPQTLLNVPRQTDFPPPHNRVLVDHKAGNSLPDSMPPKILFNPVPQYPKIARELGLEGKTLLRVEILQDGKLGAIKIRESCGHRVLDKAATEAIKKWKFAPAQDGLFTVRSVVDLPIRFSLKSFG